MSVRGLPAAVMVRLRVYHVIQVPQFCRGVRILTATFLSLLFGRDYTELPSTGRDVAPSEPGRPRTNVRS